MDADYIGIVTFLCHHLFFLDRAHTVLRIKYDDLGALDIREACKRCLTGISGSRCQDHDIVLPLILACRCDQQMRQNG